MAAIIVAIGVGIALIVHGRRGRKIDDHGSAGVPIRRDLQNGRAAETAVREQHFFAKALLADRGDHLGRNPGQVGVLLLILRVEQ